MEEVSPLVLLAWEAELAALEELADLAELAMVEVWLAAELGSMALEAMPP